MDKVKIKIKEYHKHEIELDKDIVLDKKENHQDIFYVIGHPLTGPFCASYGLNELEAIGRCVDKDLMGNFLEDAEYTPDMDQNKEYVYLGHTCIVGCVDDIWVKEAEIIEE